MIRRCRAQLYQISRQISTTSCLWRFRKEPARRNASAGQLSADIRAFLKGLPVSARLKRFATGLANSRAGIKALSRRAALLVIALICFSISMAVVAQRADRARAARREADFLSSIFVARHRNKPPAIQSPLASFWTAERSVSITIWRLHQSAGCDAE